MGGTTSSSMITHNHSVPTKKNDWVYKIIPNFTTDSDPEVKQTYEISRWKDEKVKPGTTLLVKGLKTFPKTKDVVLSSFT